MEISRIQRQDGYDSDPEDTLLRSKRQEMKREEIQESKLVSKIEEQEEENKANMEEEETKIQEEAEKLGLEQKIYHSKWKIRKIAQLEMEEFIKEYYDQATQVEDAEVTIIFSEWYKALLIEQNTAVMHQGLETLKVYLEKSRKLKDIVEFVFHLNNFIASKKVSIIDNCKEILKMGIEDSSLNHLLLTKLTIKLKDRNFATNTAILSSICSSLKHINEKDAKAVFEALVETYNDAKAPERKKYLSFIRQFWISIYDDFATISAKFKIFKEDKDLKKIQSETKKPKFRLYKQEQKQDIIEEKSISIVNRDLIAMLPPNIGEFRKEKNYKVKVEMMTNVQKILEKQPKIDDKPYVELYNLVNYVYN